MQVAFLLNCGGYTGEGLSPDSPAGVKTGERNSGDFRRPMARRMDPGKRVGPFCTNILEQLEADHQVLFGILADALDKLLGLIGGLVGMIVEAAIL